MSLLDRFLARLDVRPAVIEISGGSGSKDMTKGPVGLSRSRDEDKDPIPHVIMCGLGWASCLAQQAFVSHYFRSAYIWRTSMIGNSGYLVLFCISFYLFVPTEITP